MTRPIAVTILMLPLLSAAADSRPQPRAAILLTGNVAWHGGTLASPIDGNPDDDVITLRELVPSAMIGPIAARDAYRVVDVSRSATVGRLQVEGVRALVTAACIRAHGDVVVVRNTHCVMTNGPQVGSVNMPFGLQITAAKSVLVEDSRFDGFRWRAAADRYWNGEGISIEWGVAGVQFRGVSADGNTDAGFDVKPHAILSDVSAKDNCRNFRFWSGADAGTLMTGNTIKRGGNSTCAGIWLNGSASLPRQKLHVRKLIVRMDRPGMIIEVGNGPADVEIDECDIRAPAGTTMIEFEKGPGEVRLGRGCEVQKAIS